MLPATFLPLQPVGISTEHIDFPGTLTLPTEVALKSWMALGESVARARLEEARHRHQPWRQQRGDDAGRAGSARASRTVRRHDVLVALRRTGRTVPGGRIAPRHSWRRGRNLDHAGAISASRCASDAIADFRRAQHRDGEEISLAFDAAPGAVRLAGAGSSPKRRRSAMRRWPPRTRASGCSIMARARSANCLADVDKFDVKALSAGPKS